MIGSALACLAAALPLQEPTSRKNQAETIRRMLMELHENDEFTGSVLVAHPGIVIYRDAIAATPGDAHKLLTSPSNIASLANPFTAMAVMMLAEKGKLGYDDLIARHVPELAGATPGIKIRHLLARPASPTWATSASTVLACANATWWTRCGRTTPVLHDRGFDTATATRGM